MVLRATSSSTAGSPIDDIAYLARAEHRIPTLVALATGPLSRAELGDLTGVSSSTVRRTLREFEDRNWVRREGPRYGATQPGAFVAAAMEALIDRIEAERALRGVWQWLPGEESGFTIEMCSDAVVTVAEPDAPYRPVNRFLLLLAETDEFRFVGSDVALLEPCKDVLRRRIVDGMHTEIVDPPSVARYILSTYPDHCAAPLESGNLSVLLHDELPPYGLGLFDDRIAVSCYDQGSGAVRVLIDTDAPAAREWATATYASFRDEARPLAPESVAE
ncbi:helix-turn-helix transcriptional regulator [Salinilacihabitans rarus]|uniref:helix-turn-helix transcriptional regulator n=1 Tax=Salinilacihabitans rarus TaxID=2961596 RepID=UPI0020C8E6CC|nr:helix-turn-helix domain-containing protein [Salinilacihabitans rarus]